MTKDIIAGNKSLQLTLEGTLEVRGDLVFITSDSGLAYGSCWGNEINQPQASAVQNTWYIISDADMSDGRLHLITHDGSGKLTVAYAGVYLVNYSITLEVDKNSSHIGTGIAINGTAKNDGQAHMESRANQENVLSSTAILLLTAGQYLELAFRTTDNDSPTFNIDDVNFTIVQVSG
jgi:hypothetical protein